jgi:hypothetical protein
LAFIKKLKKKENPQKTKKSVGRMPEKTGSV